MRALIEAMEEAEKSGLSDEGRVANNKAYVDGVAAILVKAGYCATNGSRAGHTEEDEVWIRNDQFSEHYDILYGEVDNRRTWVHYAALCTGPAF